MLQITVLPNPQAVQGRTYNSAVQAINGIAPLHWTGSGLPLGLNINPTSGAISGTPTGTDQSGPLFTVTDSSSPIQSYSMYGAITVYGVLQITGSDLGNMTINQNEFVNFLFSGGVPPISFNITSGSLPPGTAMEPSGIRGTPTQLGDYHFNLSLQDSASPPQTAQGPYTVHVVPLPPAILPVQLPRGILNRAYSASLSAQNGTPPYIWSISAGNLPPGLMLDSQGVIIGSPTSVGNFSIPHF